MAAIYITLYDTGYVDGWVRSADIEEANEEAGILSLAQELHFLRSRKDCLEDKVSTLL